MTAILQEAITILNEMAIYLLFGFLLSGLLHVLLLRRESFLAPLVGRGPRPVILAALLGAPLPLCSCAVLPAGVTLHRRGASKGTVAAFFISCPETDVVSILLTYGLIGPVFTIFRPIAAIVTGIGTGLMINLVERRRDRLVSKAAPVTVPVPTIEELEGDSCGCEDSHRKDANGDNSRGGSPRSDVPRKSGCPQPHPRGWLGQALHYGFVEFFDDLIGQLLLGILIAGILAALLPALRLDQYAGRSVLSYLIMLLVGIPLYVCASASTPIAAGLMAAGVSPGAALVFLLAGPATNVASLVVVLRQFGKLVLGVYLVMVAVFTLALGVLLDLLFRTSRLPTPDLSKIVAGETAPLAWIGSAVFFGLVIASVVRRRVPERFRIWLERKTGLRIGRRVIVVAVGSLLAAGYLLSGFFIVQPGERAAVTRFGAVTQPALGPGLHFHWPAPFGRADRVSVQQIRRVEIGFRSSPIAARRLGPAAQDEGAAKPGEPAIHGSPTESWMLTGDENIVDIQAVVQYQVIDAPDAIDRYLFGLENPEALIRATAAWAMQQAVGSRSIDSLLTAERGQVEAEVVDALMQPALDRAGSGIRVVGLSLTSVHAPTPVHWAFRDVAGAAEDAANYVNQAREYSERIIREAEGDSARAILLAQGDAAERVLGASGEAGSFLAQNAEYRKAPPLTRSRLYMEKLESILPNLNLYLDLTGAQGKGPAIWLKRGEGYEGLPLQNQPSSESPPPESSKPEETP